MNRATRRAAAKGREVRFAKKVPPSLLFCRELKEMLIAEHAAVLAFRGGWAEGYHYDLLLECMVMMSYAANDSARDMPDMTALNACDFVATALRNIRERDREKGKIGATGDELKALDVLVETSADFWPRQCGTVYARAFQRTSDWKKEAISQARAMRDKAAA